MSRRHGLGLRAGFTLVELLMVITIIGILAGLASRAIWSAIRNANVTAVVFEIGQLDTAVKALKEQTGQYPPDFADVNYSSGTPNRQARFNAFIKFAFPRCTISYASLNNAMQTGNKAYLFNYNPGGQQGGGNGGYQKLNLDNMDQAEALVFWLGGFPTPYSSQTGAPMGSRKLYSFHTDVTNPFRLDQPSGALTLAIIANYRMPPKFDFDETRLVDNDQDGWLEYVPRLSASSNGMIPPYVYFDAGIYTNWPTANPPFLGYPMPTPNSPNRQMATSLMQSWGIAVPYASIVSTQGAASTQWVNPITFQIISAGVDGMYGSQNMRVPSYPSGTTFTLPGFTNASYYDFEEQDNLTNFAPGALQDQSQTTGT